MTAVAGKARSLLRSAEHALAAATIGGVAAAIVLAIAGLLLDDPETRLPVVFAGIALFFGAAMIAVVATLPILIVGRLLASLRSGPAGVAFVGTVLGLVAGLVVNAVTGLAFDDPMSFLMFVPAGCVGLPAFRHFDHKAADA